jgi:flavin reductase (DIM6/NTAB) family NADH-FMN oxidoreductase RutF
MTAPDAPHGIPVEEFAAAMQLLPGAVTIVTTRQGDRPIGFTATAVCSLSASPPQLLVCVNRSTRSYSALCATRTFAVNVLHSGDRDLADAFARIPMEDRFKNGSWGTLETGAPILTGAVVSFDCHVSGLWEQASHGILCGLILATRQSDNAPLLYARRSYTSLQGMPTVQ